MQREIAALGEPRRVTNVPEELLNMCEDELDAVRLCIQMSSYTHDYISKQLSIDKGHFSRIMTGSVGFPTHKRLMLMRLCGNRAPVQYEVMQIGLGAAERSAPDESMKTENDRLKAEISALKAALAAVLGSQITNDRVAA
jgi:hypothetical protein